jgi:hypothetical protein
VDEGQLAELVQLLNMEGPHALEMQEYASIALHGMSQDERAMTLVMERGALQLLLDGTLAVMMKLLNVVLEATAPPRCRPIAEYQRVCDVLGRVSTSLWEVCAIAAEKGTASHFTYDSLQTLVMVCHQVRAPCVLIEPG